jgi:diguanylate cyclase (GGDEF)-like protein
MTRSDMMLLALLALITLMGTLCLVVGRDGRTSAALQRYGWGMLCLAAGLAITLMAFLPAPVRMLIGNSLFAFGSIPLASGVLLHTRYRLDMRLVWPLFAATLAVLAWNNLLSSSPVSVNFIATLPLSNLLQFYVAYALLRDPPRDARSAGRVLAASFVLSRLVADSLVVLFALGYGGATESEQFDLIASAFSLAQMVLGVTNTLALLWVEVRKMEAELERIAFEDALTKLPNRRAVQSQFDQEIARAARRGETFAMLIVDLDHFKTLNDTYGHPAGDAVLTHVATVLNAERRADDLLGRIGGEEFLLLLTGINAERAADVADRIRARVAATPITLSGRRVQTSLSGGFAMYPGEGANWDELFALADARLYAAKRNGRNRIVGPIAARSRIEAVG